MQPEGLCASLGMNPNEMSRVADGIYQAHMNGEIKPAERPEPEVVPADKPSKKKTRRKQAKPATAKGKAAKR